MALSVLAFQKPVPSSVWTQRNPALRFYGAYGQDFGSANASTFPNPQKYYAKHCKMIMPDSGIIEGADKIWTFLTRDVYGVFPKVTRDILSLVVTSDAYANLYTLHITGTTTLHTEKGPVVVPQAFTYSLASADEGEGTNGLQVQELRCFYDMSLIEGAQKKA